MPGAEVVEKMHQVGKAPSFHVIELQGDILNCRYFRHVERTCSLQRYLHAEPLLTTKQHKMANGGLFSNEQICKVICFLTTHNKAIYRVKNVILLDQAAPVVISERQGGVYPFKECDPNNI